VNQLLRDWRHNNDGEEYFVRRQQGKLREWDGHDIPFLANPPTPDVRRRSSNQPALALGGAGPQTAARERAATDRTVHFAARSLPPPTTLFSSLNRDTDSDEEMIGKGKTKAQEKVKVLAVQEKVPAVQQKVPAVKQKVPVAEELSDDVREVSALPPPSDLKK
jgi:hypothetical protein